MAALVPACRGPAVSDDLLQVVKDLLRQDRAADAWAQLLAIGPEDSATAPLWYYRSLAAQQMGTPDDAWVSAQQAVALDPGQPYFQLQAGRVAAEQADHESAIAHYERAVSLQPALALAWLGLGRSLAATGQRPQARAALEKAHAINATPHVAFELARLEHAEGRPAEALFRVRQSLAGPGKPLPEALLLLGDILLQQQAFGDALSAYRAAEQAEPDNPRAGLAAALLMREQGQWEESRRAYAEIAARHPDCLRAALGAALSLPHVYANAQEVEDCRRRYAEGLEQLAQTAPETYGKPVPALLQDIRWANFLLAYQGRDDLALQSRFGDLVEGVLRSAAPEWLDLPARDEARRARVRVGFVSHFFYDCTAGRYFSSWVTGLDAGRFEVFIYYTNTRHSPNTEQIHRAAAAFRHMPGTSVHALASRVREDALDILVYPEVGMFPDTQALASLRLAPVQCVAWGHPTTTGLSTMDVFISCAAMEPPDAQAHYRERLEVLPGLGTCYEHPEPALAATRRELGLPEDKTLYLIPQSAFKIHPDNDALIAAVLSADPHGAAVFFAGEARPIIDALVRRLKPALERHGRSTREDLIFLPAMPHEAYLAVNQQCDVMLDTLHWSGGNTALDALSVGLPIVTLPGALMRGRQSSAMLRLLGLQELIASDAAEYVRLAARLGMDAKWRAQCRARILEAKGRLYGNREPIVALNELLHRLAHG